MSLDEWSQFLTLLAGFAYIHAHKNKRKHRWWIRNIIRNRGTFGTYHHLVKELELSEEEFVCYFRLNKDKGIF